MSATQVEVIEVDWQRIEQLVERLQQTDLSAEDRELIENILRAYIHLLGMIKDKKASIRRLQKLLFGAQTEKLKHLVDAQAKDSDPADTEAATAETTDNHAEAAADRTEATRPARRGHGRHGADDYSGAEQIWVAHPTLCAGDVCPQCGAGTLYQWPTPGVLIRLVGNPPIRAKVYRFEKLRCSLCGKIFTAPAPEGMEPEKFDTTTISTIALLKYGSGMPFNRLERLEANYGIPLPASTQWEAVRNGVWRLGAAYGELSWYAAQGTIIHDDDTTVKILELMQAKASADASVRHGMFTSGIVSVGEGWKIALFFSGPQYAGENLAKVLEQRMQTLGPPIQMCDGLGRNLPGDLQTILANCLAHARRKFADVLEAFPDESYYVLEALSQIYRIDGQARQQGLTPAARLALHQAESGPVMEALRHWLQQQLDERRIEPNSGFGQATQYMLKHWEPLTLFLRVPGAPLDNNICERALKKSILHRKNSYFYKTEFGAVVGDIYMSLIHTCELNGISAFDYLNTLLRHADALRLCPADWMPWNYRQTLEQRAAQGAVAIS